MVASIILILFIVLVLGLLEYYHPSKGSKNKKQSIMEEALISFETAVLAKTIGFDDMKVKLYYNKSKEISSCLYSTVRGPEIYPAPTQSLLQKWLREIHDIEVIPKRYGGVKNPKTCYNCSINKHLNESAKYTSVYDTYEEALESGLLIALTMIE